MPDHLSNPTPLLARSRTGMVTSPHRLASEAGLKVLAEGGNAIEAVIATGAVLAVTYPHFCGLGGDAVWVVADSEGRKTVFLGIGQAPQTLPAVNRVPVRGPLAALTTACLVDSWGHALAFSERNWDGTRQLPALLDDAIGHAENGFAISMSQTFWHDFRSDDMPAWPGISEAFGRVGQQVQPQLAESLKRIASHGYRDFYEGELARRIAAGLNAAGSPITAADLARTRTREEKPLSIDYRGLTLLAPPPPTQGVSTLEIMGILQAFPMADFSPDSVDFYHVCIEAVKQAFIDRRHIGDPDFSGQTPDAWLDPEHLKRRTALIDTSRAMPWSHVFRTGDTVYLAATDAQGHSVSMLQSTYYDWGSGVLAGDTGILWHNRGAAFDPSPDNPNRLQPGKRPFYTLNPGIALKDGRPHLLYGTQGADGQPQTLSVLLSRLIDHGLDPFEALSQPRFLLGRTFSDSRDNLKVEEAAGAGVLVDLAILGHEVAAIPTLSPLAGQAGVIRIDGDGVMTGAHDPRGDGCALGLGTADAV